MCQFTAHVHYLGFLPQGNSPDTKCDAKDVSFAQAPWSWLLLSSAVLNAYGAMTYYFCFVLFVLYTIHLIAACHAGKHSQRLIYKLLISK